MSHDLTLSYTTVKNGKDPDEYLRQFGTEAFKDEIAKNKVHLNS
jgi:DNA primase